MGFEDIPEDREESFPCECGGDITKTKTGTPLYACNKCDWTSAPKFKNVSCSQCGESFGPGNSGFSHCEDHKEKPIFD